MRCSSTSPKVVFPAALTFVAIVQGLIIPTTDDNMNGNDYLLQATPHGQEAVANWSTTFKDYPGGVEYFEVYAGPITTTYGQVFWTGLPASPVPADIVKRFDGKVMAVVGFEADQVMRKGDKDPYGKVLEEEVSVPINVAYNHHYGATLVGAGSSMKKVKTSTLLKEGDHRALHPGPDSHRGLTNIAVEHTPSASGAPTSFPFGYSNGGEFRKTYHGLVPPFAQLIESPQQVHCGPMQIDTWNRDKMNVTGGAFVPGPAPELSYAPQSGVDAIYSGLLECPLTTRLRKQITGGGWNDTFAVQLSGCSHEVTSAEDCFAVAAKEIGVAGSFAITTGSGSSESLPGGCSVLVNSTGAHLYFNRNANSNAGCGETTVTSIAGTEPSLVNLTISLGGDAALANITMVGPSNVWFGVGFDTQFMTNAPYAITVDGHSGAVTERVLGNHAAGIVLNASITVISNTVVNGVRTITMQRPLQGLTPHHHDFDPKQMSLNFINAIGDGPDFAYHKTKTTATLALWPTSYKAAVDPTAKGGEFGIFGGAPGTSGKFRNDYNGEVGYTLTPKQDLAVTALGRSGTKLKALAAVTIWDSKTRKPIAKSAVGQSASTFASSGYEYVNLTTPVILKKGEEYFVTLGVTRGMPDQWADTNINADGALGTFAAIGTGVFSSTPGKCPDTTSTAGRWAGIATFMIDVKPHPAPPATGTPASCVCSIPAAPFGQGEGTLKYLETGEVIGFPFRCNLGDADFSVMKNKNPTCDIRTYVGGLSTCHHKWHLLDADQELPWSDIPITYYMKYRLYFQEYIPAPAPAPAPVFNAASHVDTFDITWSIAGATGEYDVPRCPEGTPTELCTHEISGTIVPSGADYHFVAAHYHCHAPTCISLEIWNNSTDTPELLCKEVPYHGAASAATQSDRFDEPGYIAQRVCLWGIHPPFEYPPFVSGQKLWVKAVTNSTYGHHGEMALPQMLLASMPKQNASIF